MFIHQAGPQALVQYSILYDCIRAKGELEKLTYMLNGRRYSFEVQFSKLRELQIVKNNNYSRDFLLYPMEIIPSGSHFRGVSSRASIAGFEEEFELHESLAVVVGVESRFPLDGAGRAVVFPVFFSLQSKFTHAGLRAPTERSALRSRPASRFIHGERVWITRLSSSSSAVSLPT